MGKSPFWHVSFAIVTCVIGHRHVSRLPSSLAVRTVFVPVILFFKHVYFAYLLKHVLDARMSLIFKQEGRLSILSKLNIA